MGEGGRKMRGIGIGLSDFKELITEKEVENSLREYQLEERLPEVQSV